MPVHMRLLRVLEVKMWWKLGFYVYRLGFLHFFVRWPIKFHQTVPIKGIASFFICIVQSLSKILCWLVRVDQKHCLFQAQNDQFIKKINSSGETVPLNLLIFLKLLQPGLGPWWRFGHPGRPPPPWSEWWAGWFAPSVRPKSSVTRSEKSVR
jgi:hypothetical protein